METQTREARNRVKGKEAGVLSRIPDPPKGEYRERVSTSQMPAGDRSGMHSRQRHTRRRSEERRGGKEGVSTGRSRWSPYHSKKHINRYRISQSTRLIEQTTNK